jgi:alpha-N-arabinofuranosidase
MRSKYVIGDTNTKWGAQRARDGHPRPFKLNYIEIGNEDGFDNAKSYDGRFTQFYDAIKAKYPQLKLISTVGGIDPIGKRQQVTSRSPHVIDEHYYRNAFEMEYDATHYDSYSRTGPKLFVGEWATREGTAITLSSAQPGDTNSITQPTKIVPVTTKATGLGPQFSYTFAPYSVTVLVISMR